MGGWDFGACSLSVYEAGGWLVVLIHVGGACKFGINSNVWNHC